jgi:protein-disulfide isomerase
MTRTPSAVLLLGLFLCPAAFGQSFPTKMPSMPSKEKMISHIRETHSIPGNVPMTVTEFEASPIEGLLKAGLTIGEGDRAQKTSIYLSAEGRWYFLADPQDLSIDPDKDRVNKMRTVGSLQKGPIDAKVTVVEFTDLQCPFCRKAHLAIKEELPKMGVKVRWVLKHFPLSGMHPWAETAAIATACATKQNPATGWDLADGFFENQAAVTKENVKAKALEFGAKAKLDAKKLETCIDNKETLDDVKRDQADGAALGVQSTPSFFINGHALRGFNEFAPMKQLIEEMNAGKHP